jgi:transposase-like protein
VADVLLRERRALDGAKAFFAQAITRRDATPAVVIPDGHHADGRAVLEHASGAAHIVTELHRAAGHETTLAVEHSQMPVKDKVRPMRGLQSSATSQRLLDGITAAQAIRRGDVSVAAGPPRPRRTPGHATAWLRSGSWPASSAWPADPRWG